MSRRMRVLFAGLTALPLAVVGLSLGAGSASATSGGCFLPEFAADLFGSENLGYFNEVVLSDDSGRLKSQCKYFLKACQQIVKQTTNCMESVIGSELKGGLERCKDPAADPDCKSSANSDFNVLQGITFDSKAEGYDVCQLCYEDCLERITGDCSPFDDEG